MPPDPEPKTKLLERALQVFSEAELEMLLGDLEAVKSHGYGGVYIVFDNHHPQKSEPTFSKLLPKKPTTYRAE